MLTLLVLQGPDKGRRYEMPDSPILIGRESRQLPLTDSSVSRRHAELLPQEDGEWVLSDMGSSNGTYVNSIKIGGRHYLKLGDQIRVGRTLMLFGSQPGVTRTSGGNVNLAGEESGMDSAIIASAPANDESLVLAVPEPSAAATSNLKMIYQLQAAMGSSFKVDQVLEVIMDLVLAQMKADRGIILFIDDNNELFPKVVRVREEKERDMLTPQPTKILASRTIVNHVVQNGQGVLSSNAMMDRRFSSGKSVQNLGIRSALCVPIKARRLDGKEGDEIVGVIYIDSSVKNYTYSPDQLRLLSSIGLQAGLAVQNARLYQQGLQAERMAAIGETTAALSHSIKNILQALHGGSDVVEMGIRNNNMPQVAKGWDIVQRNQGKIYGLTMNLLAYSKEREPRLELTGLKRIVDDCVELIAQAAAQKKAMVVADIDRDLPPAPMDPDGIHQVMMNLLSNALDAVEDGKGLIKINGVYDAEQRQVVIEVSDNGVGIPETIMPHIFELFHSTKGNRGTGLGLAVARKIVMEHEGTILVSSEPNQGTVFIVRIPTEHSKLIDPSSTSHPR